MSKKKHKKKKKEEVRYLTSIEQTIETKHDEAIEEIMKMEKKIKKKDKKAKKKAKKQKYNGILSKYSPTAEMQKVRIDAYKHMKKIDLLGVVEDILKSAAPIIKTIARLIASLITLIFQCKQIRELIPMKFLAKMEHVYQLAMAI